MAGQVNEIGAGRSHCTEGELLPGGSGGVWVVSDETLNADGTTVITHPLGRLVVDGEALLTVDQLLAVSDMCARAAVILGKIERGESL